MTYHGIDKQVDYHRSFIDSYYETQNEAIAEARATAKKTIAGIKKTGKTDNGTEGILFVRIASVKTNLELRIKTIKALCVRLDGGQINVHRKAIRKLIRDGHIYTEGPIIVDDNGLIHEAVERVNAEGGDQFYSLGTFYCPGAPGSESGPPGPDTFSDDD